MSKAAKVGPQMSHSDRLSPLAESEMKIDSTVFSLAFDFRSSELQIVLFFKFDRLVTTPKIGAISNSTSATSGSGAAMMNSALLLFRPHVLFVDVTVQFCSERQLQFVEQTNVLLCCFSLTCFYDQKPL